MSLTNCDVPYIAFGERAGAGVDYEAGLDEVAPAPTGTAAYACILNASVSNPEHSNLTMDFRPEATTTRWRLWVDVAESRNPVELSWDVSWAARGREVYLQRIVGELPTGAPIDMKTTAGTTVTEDAEFEIAYSVADSASLPLLDGWNLVGIPVMTLETVEELFGERNGAPDRDGLLWYWQGAVYDALSDSQPMNAERGYWVFALASGSVTDIAGVPADGVVMLLTGWNLLSPTAACSLPDGVMGPAWYWHAASQTYRPIHTGDQTDLQPGMGYWLFRQGEPVVVDLGD